MSYTAEGACKLNKIRLEAVEVYASANMVRSWPWPLTFWPHFSKRVEPFIQFKSN